jgi:spoIIIJ-associated protein
VTEAEATKATTDTTDVAERACDFLQGVLERMGIQADIDVNEGEEKIVLEIQTGDPEVVIGRKGQVVDALQHLVSKVVYRERAGEKGKPIVVDSGGYRDKHVLRLQSLAQRMGEKALATAAIVELSPTAWLFPLADRTVLYHPETGQENSFGDGRNHGLVPIVRTAKGTLVSGMGLRSTDAGKSWAEIKPFPDVSSQGWRQQMMALKNGWLLASQSVGPGVGGDKIHFIVSRDDGQSWDLDHPVEFYHPGRAIGGRACPRTVEIDPSYAAAFNNLAVAYEREGRLDEAREAYERALQLEPNNAMIRQNYELFEEVNERSIRRQSP